MHVRKHRPNVPDDAGHHGQGQLIELHPLTEHAIVGEPAPHHLEKLGRVQGSHPGHPGVAGFGGDNVVAGRVQLERAACVIDHDGDVGPGEHSVVDVEEVSRRTEHRRLDFDHTDALHPGDVGQHAGGHAASVAHHEGGARGRPGRDGRQPGHDLRIHVAVVRRIRLAVHLERAASNAVPDRYGGVPSFRIHELARPPMGEKLRHHARVHRRTGVDAGPEVDQPGAPVRRGERGDKREHGQPCGGEDAELQRTVLGRALRDSARRQPDQHKGRHDIDAHAHA